MEHFAQCQPFEAFELLFGFLAAMRFDNADHNVDTLLQQRARGHQHGVGFTHAGGRAEKNLQPAARGPRLFLLHAVQQFIGIGSARAHVLWLQYEGFYRDYNARLSDSTKVEPAGFLQ